MAYIRMIDVIKEDYPRIWWMVFLPSVLFYGTLVYLFICWLGYRADVRALEARYEQAKQHQAQMRSRQRYQKQLATQASVGNYEDSVTHVAGWK